MPARKSRRLRTSGGHDVAWKQDDGGRVAAKLTGGGKDCVVRAIAIALERPYAQVHADLEALYGLPARLLGFPREVYEPYLQDAGWEWVPTMHVGQGCRVHLRQDELPDGRLIVRVSRHLVAVIDGIIHDTHNPARNGTRCVYGYYRKQEVTG